MWTWNDEKVDTLTDQMVEYKTQRSYEGYNFQINLFKIYSDYQKWWQ